jgi:hypothetical protein
METCCAALAAIARFCAQYASGLSTSIWIIEKCDVESIPAMDAADHRITGDIVLKTGKFWFLWNIGDTDAEYTYTSAGQSGSRSFNSVLTFFLPVIRSVVDHLLNNIVNGEFLVVFMDKEGNKQLLGSLANPIKFADGGISGVKNTDSNGTTCTMERIGGISAPFYDGALLTEAVV